MSASFEPDTINVEGLEKFLKALKRKPPIARIGVLADTENRGKKEGAKSASGNAEIAAAHEYGAPARGLASRSILRMPLTEHLQGNMEKEGLLTEQVAREVLRKGSLLPWMKQVAMTAVATVKEAFATQGWGSWPAWKDPKYKNNTMMLLQDTQQLRESITKEVKENET